MRPLGTISVIASVVIIASAFASSSAPARGDDAKKKAPDFSAKGTDGKTHTLASLTKKDTALVLYFIGNTCPTNAEAVPFYKEISKAYKGKVNFVGVIDADEETYKDWQNEFKTKFTVLYDPDLEIIKKYKALASPWAVLVSPDGEIVKKYAGFSGKSLQSLSNEMAKFTKTKAATINTKGAPEDDVFG